MLAEWGIGEFPKSGDKAQWITDAFHIMKTRFPRLKAAVFWSERWENDDGTYSNLRVASSPERSKPIEEVWPPHSGWDRPIYR